MARTNDTAATRLSAVLVVGDQRKRAQRALDALAGQTAVEQMEIVVVDLAGQLPHLRTAEPPRTTYLSRPGVADFGEGRAEGVRAARGDVVAFLEDHCYATPGWAAALIEAFETSCDAVGYAFRNANPETYRSRACIVHDYGAWLEPARGGPAHFLPSNNVSYRRALLLPYLNDLADRFAIDFNLHEVLRVRGARFHVEPRAVVEHENFTHVLDLCRASFDFCRVLAANRVAVGGWSRERRLVYGLGAPLGAPAIKLMRLVAGLRGRRRLWPSFAASLPVLLAAYAWAAFGEAAGYLAGPGKSEQRLTWWELGAPRTFA